MPRNSSDSPLDPAHPALSATRPLFVDTSRHGNERCRAFQVRKALARAR